MRLCRFFLRNAQLQGTRASLSAATAVPKQLEGGHASKLVGPALPCRAGFLWSEENGAIC